jgi:type VI secretion system protein ImpM
MTAARPGTRAPAVNLFGTGVLGKIRAQGDFLRINATDPAVPAFARFLEDGNELLHEAGTQLDPEPIGFVFAAPETGRVLVGGLGPGIDSVGRPYPLAVFEALSARELSHSFPLVPSLYGGFLVAAGGLVREAPDLSPPEIVGRLADIPLPGSFDLAAAESTARESRRERAAELSRRLFGDPASGQRYYGFHTFQTACRLARDRDPGRVNVALHCPCERESDAGVWLTLARAILRRPSVPSFFFRGPPRPALVLSLGSPSPALLSYFAASPRGHQKIWPLTTQQPAAIAAARKALPASQLLVIDAAFATVDELICALSSG